MQTIPPEEDVRTYVRLSIADVANYPEPDLEDGMVLRNNPLRLDDAQLATLALRWSSYTEHYNPGSNVLVSEVRRTGLTAGQSVQLVWGKLQAPPAPKRRVRKRRKRSS